MLAALAAIICTAVYQIWAGSKQKELGVGSMQLMHQFQPHASGLLALMVAGLEPVGLPGTPHALGQGTIWGYKYTPLSVIAILTSAVLGLLVSLSTFLVIGATSSVTFNVVSVITSSKHDSLEKNPPIMGLVTAFVAAEMDSSMWLQRWTHQCGARLRVNLYH